MRGKGVHRTDANKHPKETTMTDREFKQTLKECQAGLPRAAAVAAGVWRLRHSPDPLWRWQVSQLT